MASRRVVTWAAFALLLLVLLFWLWPLFAGESLFWGLPALQFYPWRSYAFDQMRTGQLPLWNPYNGGGAPLLANYQVAVFYPPNWLHLILPHVAAMNLLAVAHVLWAALGMWLLAREYDLPDFGRAVSMLSFALGGYLAGRLGSFATAAAIAWLPWLICALVRLLAGGQRRDGLTLAGVTAMLLLAGHAQTAYYVLLAGGAFALWRGLWLPEGRWRAWGLALASVLMGLALAAVQLVPTAQLLLHSSRADGLGYGWTTNFSYSLARSLTLVAPNLYGTPADGSYLTEGAYFEDAAYIGLLPLIAALFALVGWLRERRDAQSAVLRDVPFWAGMGLLAFLIALGKNGFVFPLLYRFVPTFKAFQGPVRWLLLLVFPLSLLAGIGVSTFWGKGRWVIFWSRLTAAGGMGMALVALFAAPRLLPPDIEGLAVMVRGLVALGLILSGCAILTLLQPDPDRPRRRIGWQVAVLVFVAADLGWAFHGINPTVPAAFFTPLERPEYTGQMLYLPETVEHRLKFDAYFTLDDYRVAVAHWSEVRRSLLPNLNMLDGVTMFNNFEPMVTGEYAAAQGVLEAAYHDQDGLVVLAEDEVFRQEPFGKGAVLSGGVVTLLAIVCCTALWMMDKRGAILPNE